MSMHLEPGSVIDGCFDVLDLLAEGTYGPVYVVRQHGNETPLALKVLEPQHIGETPDFEAFRDEMMALSALDHPNLVPMVGSGQIESGPIYHVQHVVDGESLRARLQRCGRIEVAELIPLMTQILSALVCAHDHGRVHRGLKPENIILHQAQGLPVATVLDVGVASAIERARRLPSGRLATLVLTGERVGAPEYLAPEQLTGSISPQSDIYAWGLIVLEGLTGRPVFDTPHLAELVHHQLSPQPLALPPELSLTPLGALLSRALAKSPDARWSTARELLQALTALEPREAVTPVSHDATELGPGTLVAERYAISHAIGQGGFGVIYRAVQQGAGKVRAIKVLSPDKLAGSPTPQLELQRFEREMHLIARLEHPNIVQLIDTGRLPDGRLFMVLQHIEGLTLRSLLKHEGQLEPHEAIRLMTQVLSALVAAHRAGIVHRDIKPENIMVRTAGGLRSAVVLDFGIANLVEAARGLEHGRLGTLAITHQLVGTPKYMAPEQLRGEITPQTDIYAWGLVFLECLTGISPISASSFAEVIARQMSAEPAPMPDWLSGHPLGQLLARAMAKDLNERATTSLDLLHDLLDILPPPFTRPAPPQPIEEDTPSPEASSDPESLVQAIPGLTEDEARALTALDIPVTHLALLPLLPLVQLAWAEGQVHPNARKVIERFARERKIASGSAEEAHLASLLQSPPEPELLLRAIDALRRHLETLPPDRITHAKLIVYQRSVEVAEASANRFNPFANRITPAELNALDVLRKRLGLPNVMIGA